MKYSHEFVPRVEITRLREDKARMDLLDRADIVIVESGPLGFSCFEDEDLRTAIDEYMEDKKSRVEVKRLKRLLGKS